MSQLELKPFIQDYSSKEEVLAAWNSGASFRTVYKGEYGLISKSEIPAEIESLKFRFKEDWDPYESAYVDSFVLNLYV